ncbi:MAG: tyrosine--tRNA ligase [Chitinivibrionales bacterium]|nr:tyrosine--tRNA ligase [Chitinivibrionales bacterium]
MAVDFLEELRWRGMIHDCTPGTEERLRKGTVTGYAGFDPTAQSLQIGNLVPIMMLVHLQRAGHKPLALVGGATGLIGDPSGKSAERNLMTVEEVRENAERFRAQLEHFLDFGSGPSAAEIVNNYDWFAEIRFLDFLRDVGKHLTIGYMLAKESVQQRLEAGISFTEFSYQLLQAYDFYWLYSKRKCELQVGGSDQWGNITSGTELVRRKAGGEAFALTCPLITKADGTKFGKSAAGERIFLDPKLTSPYRFYQFWLNSTDDDAGRYLRVFTLLPREQVESLEQEHAAAPHTRVLQKALARDMCVRVHSEQAYQRAVQASEILFGGGTAEALTSLPEEDLLAALEGVPRFSVSRDELSNGVNVVELMAAKTDVCSSKGEARRLLKGGGVSINKARVTDEAAVLTTDALLDDRYLLVQKGKKNYFLVIAQ